MYKAAAATLISARQMANIYLINLIYDNLGSEERKIADFEIAYIKNQYLRAFRELMTEQIQKYLRRGRVTPKLRQKEQQLANARLSEFPALFQETFRSDMNRINERWVKIAQAIAGLESSSSTSAIISALDLVNSQVHNSKELVLEKFPGGDALIEMLNFKFQASPAELYQRASGDVQEIAKPYLYLLQRGSGVGNKLSGREIAMANTSQWAVDCTCRWCNKTASIDLGPQHVSTKEVPFHCAGCGRYTVQKVADAWFDQHTEKFNEDREVWKRVPADAWVTCRRWGAQGFVYTVYTGKGDPTEYMGRDAAEHSLIKEFGMSWAQANEVLQSAALTTGRKIYFQRLMKIAAGLDGAMVKTGSDFELGTPIKYGEYNGVFLRKSAEGFCIVALPIGDVEVPVLDVEVVDVGDSPEDVGFDTPETGLLEDGEPEENVFTEILDHLNVATERVQELMGHEEAEGEFDVADDILDTLDDVEPVGDEEAEDDEPEDKKAFALCAKDIRAELGHDQQAWAIQNVYHFVMDLLDPSLKEQGYKWVQALNRNMPRDNNPQAIATMQQTIDNASEWAISALTINRDSDDASVLQGIRDDLQKMAQMYVGGGRTAGATPKRPGGPLRERPIKMNDGSTYSYDRGYENTPPGTPEGRRPLSKKDLEPKHAEKENRIRLAFWGKTDEEVEAIEPETTEDVETPCAESREENSLYPTEDKELYPEYAKRADKHAQRRVHVHFANSGDLKRAISVNRHLLNVEDIRQILSHFTSVGKIATHEASELAHWFIGRPRLLTAGDIKEAALAKGVGIFQTAMYKGREVLVLAVDNTGSKATVQDGKKQFVVDAHLLTPVKKGPFTGAPKDLGD